jgi:hypothetical protein
MVLGESDYDVNQLPAIADNSAGLPDIKIDHAIHAEISAAGGLKAAI